MSCLVAFHYRSYGTFFYNKIGSIISIGDLPTINIIEPKKTEFINILSKYYSLSFLRRTRLNPLKIPTNPNAAKAAFDSVPVFGN